MIASIRGKIFRITLSSVHIETASGLGYEVLIPFPVHWELKNRNAQEDVFLFIHHSINDRGERLFGFLSYRDKELFLLMKSMNGIGELTALKILSFYNGESLYKIAREENKALLEKIPKVKGKTSEKILFELKQNLKKIESFLTPVDVEDGTKAPLNTLNEQAGDSLLEPAFDQRELAILGLIQLGFDEKTARKEVELHWNKNIREASNIIGSILKNL